MALRCLWLVGLGVVAWYAITGSDYYATALILRPRHPDYWALKPGGTTGHFLGSVGSFMMVLLLGYSLRKRWGRLRKLGALPTWLDVHIWLGAIGPLLVILHTSFKVHGLVALSFWSMIIVAVSGVLGRYLYLQIPRTRRGDEMSLRQLEARQAELQVTLRQQLTHAPQTLERLEALEPRAPEASGLAAMAVAVVDDLVLPFRVGRALRSSGVPRALRREIGALLRHQWRLRRRIALWSATQRLFHYWHVAHKPFAAIMYLFMLIHILVALATGYAWGGQS